MSTSQHPAAHEVSSPPQGKASRTAFWNSVAGAILLAVVAAVVVFLVSSTADLFMLKEHETPRITIELSDLVSAAVISVLSYRLIRLQQLRRERLRHRVEVISDMNHHVRNALQVISLTTHGKDRQEISAVRESVNRIQWALRELLPKI